LSGNRCVAVLWKKLSWTACQQILGVMSKLFLGVGLRSMATSKTKVNIGNLAEVLTASCLAVSVFKDFEKSAYG